MKKMWVKVDYVDYNLIVTFFPHHGEKTVFFFISLHLLCHNRNKAFILLRVHGDNSSSGNCSHISFFFLEEMNCLYLANLSAKGTMSSVVIILPTEGAWRAARTAEETGRWRTGCHEEKAERKGQSMINDRTLTCARSVIAVDKLVWWRLLLLFRRESSSRRRKRCSKKDNWMISERQSIYMYLMPHWGLVYIYHNSKKFCC